ncbi:hypothetical protein BLNAU_18493 [Blattamonas nauphoetae]|uniref:Uncharacterized protein n=1 Tax=Blattamonas nauphoetae TaxID=2049346 RepID=A0ABQ9X481_9EUKA|nr:hypothetical protein BLNAU_18493 [Blattamonas nauphoetae]
MESQSTKYVKATSTAVSGLSQPIYPQTENITLHSANLGLKHLFRLITENTPLDHEIITQSRQFLEDVTSKMPSCLRSSDLFSLLVKDQEHACDAFVSTIHAIIVSQYPEISMGFLNFLVLLIHHGHPLHFWQLIKAGLFSGLPLEFQQNPLNLSPPFALMHIADWASKIAVADFTTDFSRETCVSYFELQRVVLSKVIQPLQPFFVFVGLHKTEILPFENPISLPVLIWTIFRVALDNPPTSDFIRSLPICSTLTSLFTFTDSIEFHFFVAHAIEEGYFGPIRTKDRTERLSRKLMQRELIQEGGEDILSAWRHLDEDTNTAAIDFEINLLLGETPNIYCFHTNLLLF